jgi:hypothetical protein
VGGLGRAELIREGATLVMLATAAWLAARSFRPRFGYFLMAFGVWDIGYYVFLKVLTDWPGSLFDWDILFLLPLPWWGPVLAPVTIAALMIVTGSLLTLTAPRDGGRGPRARAWWIAAAGATLALLVFMRDALQAVVTGNTALREVLPETFPWPVFLIAVGLMAAPAWDLFRERLGALAPTLSRRGAENVGSEQTLPSTLRISDAPTSSAEKDVAKRW